ncbi:hypothetical protein LOK85_12255 [Xylella fastidiosa subsp. multiplex]|nr:hypothetical protein [Xylella fastidiosa]MDC6416647.1 hypothetical protein [Xylella fastidiosa subsp. multiplex]
MSTATLENVPTTEGARFTKIYDEHGDHIITRDEATGLEWLAWNLNQALMSTAMIVMRQRNATD